MHKVLLAFTFVVSFSAAAAAASISGVVTDTTGAAVPDARVVLREIATGQETIASTTADGRYAFEARSGAYLVVVSRTGFADVVRTILVEDAEQKIDLPVTLQVGAMSAEVTVTAVRGERELRQIPLHVEAIPDVAVEQMNTLSTGDALAPAVQRHAGGQRALRRASRGCAASTPRVCSCSWTASG